MSKAMYVGVPSETDSQKSVARKVTKLYIGVDGIARRVKKAYVGVDGVAKLVYSTEN